MIKQEIKNIKYDKIELVKFSRLMSAAFLIVAFFLWYYKKNTFQYFIIISGLFFIIGLFAPQLLKTIYKLWMTLAVILGWFMTRVILSILYYIVITPIGLIAKLFGKKFIEKNFDRKKTTYWNYRKSEEKSKEEYERQF